MRRWRRPRHVAVLAALAAASSALTACGPGGGSDAEASHGDTALRGTVTVLAAASLTDALPVVAAAFESVHPGVEVDLSFDGSSRLAAQIVEGVPADVFASADEASMRTVADAGAAAGNATVFATNRLVIVVPAGNPDGVEGLVDLPSLRRLVFCQPQAPCGAYTAQAFARAGLPVPAAALETSVRGVLTKVQLGEADAGLVYATDVAAAPEVESVGLDPGEQVVAAYPATVLRDAPNATAARALVAFLTGAEARRILRAAGFGLP